MDFNAIGWSSPLVLVPLALFFVAGIVWNFRFYSKRRDDISLALSRLIENSQIDEDFAYEKIIGSYLGHPVSIKWTGLYRGGPSSVRGTLSCYVEIQNIVLPLLHNSFNQTDLWHEISTLPNVVKVELSNQILYIQLEWSYRMPSTEGRWFTSVGPEEIARRVKTILELVQKMLNDSC